MTEAAWRLAIVLPAVLLLLGGILVAARRGLIRLPGATVGPPPLRVVQVATLTPVSKIVVAEFGGETLLIGVARGGISVLART